MNQKSTRWLHSLKIPPGHINQAQLKNGYLFGLIFQKLNLVRDKKFKNNHDLPCIFQNFKNTKDLLYDNFGIMFPANQIIYRYGQLLQKVRQACEDYQNNKKQIKLAQIKKKYQNTNSNTQINTISSNEQKFLSLRQKEIQKQANTLNNNNMTLNKTSNQPKLPPKILQIEKKLTKYKQEQTRHELNSLQNRKRQLDQANQTIQDHRYFQMSKLKMTQQMRKQLQRRVVQVVAKTQQKKQQRIQKDQQFFRFMKSKKDNFYNQLKNQQQKSFKQGLEDFQLNCLRQGVQLQHDPNRKFEPKQDNFNQKVVLERIKDNIKTLQKQRRQREKRANSKFVETEQANIKSQKIWEENYLLERLEKNMLNHSKYLDQTHKMKNFQKATKSEIQIKLSKKVAKPLPQATQQQKQEFQSQIRRNRLIYYDKQIERLQKRDNLLKSIATQALDALLYTVIVAQEEQKNLNFTFSQWKKLQNVFMQFETAHDQKRKNDRSIQKNKEPLENQIFKNYVQSLKNIQSQNTNQNGSQQKQLAQFIDSLIQSAYPKKQQVLSANLPTYMPLRIAFSGTQLNGKTTQIKKLLAKYNNLILIDPKKIINEALQLARPPPVNQDPKKKKDPKKVQEQTPQKLQLKKFGQQLLAQIKSQLRSQTQLPAVIQYQDLDFKYVIKAIKFKLLQNYTSIPPQKILQKYNKAHQNQLQRINDFQKNQQEKNKKKDSKKGVPTQAITQSPTFNQYFYTEGFIIDNVNFTDEKLRLIQRQMNGFIKIEQRLNPDAEKLRQQLSQILPIQKTFIPDTLNKGFFNILIQLQVSSQVQQERNQGRKMDPTTGQLYHPKFAPVPTDVKGLAQRLVELKKYQLQSAQQTYSNKLRRANYYKSFGYENMKLISYNQIAESTIEDVNIEINKIIQNTLKIQYEFIKGYSQPSQSQINKQQTINKDQNPQQSAENPNQVPIQASQNNNNLSSISSSAASQLLKKLQSFNSNYQQTIISSFKTLFTTIRHEFEQEFMNQQRQFVQIIARPDDKANKILTFQDNFNKLLQEKANVINDKQAIKHLIDKLDQLYDSLWVNIQSKKNQAINKRKNILSNNWLNSQVQKIVQIGKEILQSQLNYIVDILSFILLVQIQIQGKNVEPVIDYLCLGIPKENQPIQSILTITQQQKTSQRFEYYLNQVDQCLSSISQWFQKKQIQSKIKLSSSLQQLSQIFIKKQQEKIKSVSRYLREQLFSYMEEQVCYYKALINKMDDWIIFGIKQQNDFTYKIYKQLKVSIQKISRSQLKDLFPSPITNYIKPIQRISKFHQSIPYKNNLKDFFDYSSFKIFLQQIKCYGYTTNSKSGNSEGIKINFSRLKDYFNKRTKSKSLSEIYLKVDFDTMQQYLVIQNQANLKQLALGLLFWNFKVLDEQILNNYLINLSQNRQRQYISHPQELSIEQILLQTKSLSQKQIKSLQYFIFDIMKSEYTDQFSIKQYIDILRMFNSLQLFKYGDSLMMLNEQKQK